MVQTEENRSRMRYQTLIPHYHHLQKNSYVLLMCMYVFVLYGTITIEYINLQWIQLHLFLKKMEYNNHANLQMTNDYLHN